MSVEDFHRNRRMFAIVAGDVIIGPKDSPMSHSEWFESIGKDAEKTENECVRGFADERGLFFYRGKKFDATEDDEKELVAHLEEIANALELSLETLVFMGMKKTADTIWPPKKKIGTVGVLTGKN